MTEELTILKPTSDLTIIFLTLNRLPKKWVEYQKETLLKAVGDSPVITISREPLDWGTNLIQTEEPSAANIYRQMLRGAKLATTPYVAIAEDDTLYPEEHFKFRSDKFAYNMSRWGILSWMENPAYYYRHRESNSTLIAPKELLIECLEQYPEGFFGEVGKERVMKKLGLDYKAQRFHSQIPVVNFAHVYAIDELEQKQRKSETKALRAYDIPHWGRASELVKKFQ